MINHSIYSADRIWSDKIARPKWEAENCWAVNKNFSDMRIELIGYFILKDDAFDVAQRASDKMMNDLSQVHNIAQVFGHGGR